MIKHTPNILATIAAALLATQMIQAQSTVYVSNLADASIGSEAVGNNSWFAAAFTTGTNAGGYSLDSVQLNLADVSGSPTAFTVMVYSIVGSTAGFPGTSLATLQGLADPATAGLYSYVNNSNFVLSPNTVYCIVLTAGSSIATGAFEWSITSTPTTGYNDYHWGGEHFFYTSSDGLKWSFASNAYGLFSLSATPIPEPGILSLLAVGGVALLFCGAGRRWGRAALAPGLSPATLRVKSSRRDDGI